MPKINVYLPDELADAVRDSALPVSTICQRALEQAVRRMTTIRAAVLSDLDRDSLAARVPSFTPRLVTVLTLAADRAKQTDAATVTTGDLLHGMIAEGDNLALQVLTAMDIAPESLTVRVIAPDSLTAMDTAPESLIAPTRPEPGPDLPGLRFSTPAAVTLELAVTEAVGFGHNYVGCEHLLVALAGEPDGAAGDLLRARGADAKATRRAVAAAVAGYAHLRSATPPAKNPLLAAIRAEIAPLVERIERLEAR